MSRHQPRDIHQRAFAFACRIVELHVQMRAAGGPAWTIGTQVLRAGTAIGANLEEATAAHSRSDFISRVGIALREAREAHYWLRLVRACHLAAVPLVEPLVSEADTLVAILTTIRKNAQSHLKEK